MWGVGWGYGWSGLRDYGMSRVGLWWRGLWRRSYGGEWCVGGGGCMIGRSVSIMRNY